MDVDATQAAFAAALLDASLPVPADVAAGSGASAAGRFAVYRNNVAVGLRRALARNFPVVARLVGEEFFAALAHAYAGRRLPDTPLLFTYGRDFADFIGTFEPAASVPYLADVARLEFARLVAYHAADAETLDIASLAGFAPARLAAATLCPHPACRLVASRFPIGAIWLAHQGTAVGTVSGGGPERVLLTRPGLEVRMTKLEPAELALAAALLRGMPIGEAARAAAADAAFEFGTAIVKLAEAGAFSEIRLPAMEMSQ